MFSSHQSPISRLVFISAHCGTRPDEGNCVYSVAALGLTPGQPVCQFESLVRYGHLGERERCHSHITRDQLAEAPTADSVSRQLIAFAGDVDFFLYLGMPAGIEATTRICGIGRCIDLGFAAEFFLPHLDAFSPLRLWEHLHGRRRERISFSALELAQLAVELVRHILLGALNDNHHEGGAALRHYLAASNTLFGQVFVHLVRCFNDYFPELFAPRADPDTPDWRRFLTRTVPSGPQPVSDTPRRRVTDKKIAELFAGMAEAGRGYRLRPSQVAFAQTTVRALNDGAIQCIEAATGTGKTQGYLLPLLAFLSQNPDVRAVIATYTKSLQEQLFYRELVFARELFAPYRNIPVSLLKGKSSYLCSVKIDYLYNDAMTGRELLAWLYLVNLVYHFEKADADSVGARVRFHLDHEGHLGRMLAEASARSGCDVRHVHCPAQVVAGQARRSRLVVTNHHKLALMGGDPIFSGWFRYLVIDEANHFENAVRNAFQVSAASHELQRATTYLVQSIGRILPRAAGDAHNDLSDALTLIVDMGRQVTILRQALALIANSGANSDVKELPAAHQAFENGHLRHHLEAMAGLLQQLFDKLALFGDADQVRLLKVARRTVTRLRQTREEIDAFGLALKIIQESLGTDNRVAAFQLFQRHWTLLAHDVDVDRIIREHIYGEKESVIFTAATLRHGERFDSFRRIVGLDEPLVTDVVDAPAKERRFDFFASPFAKDAMQVVVPAGAVSGRYDNKEIWLERVVRLLPELIVANRGRTLVLFASYSDLAAVAERVAGPIREAGLPLLIQRKNMPTVTLCDEFRVIKESVLFGVDTFWYGVDFKGDTLTQVIITRIPYSSPSDPLQMARKRRDTNEFWKRYHYDMHIKLRQGMGRLIRCDSDRGRVVILDSRFRL